MRDILRARPELIATLTLSRRPRPHSRPCDPARPPTRSPSSAASTKEIAGWVSRSRTRIGLHHQRCAHTTRGTCADGKLTMAKDYHLPWRLRIPNKQPLVIHQSVDLVRLRREVGVWPQRTSRRVITGRQGFSARARYGPIITALPLHSRREAKRTYRRSRCPGHIRRGGDLLRLALPHGHGRGEVLVVQDAGKDVPA